MNGIETMVQDLVNTYHEVCDENKKLFSIEQKPLGKCPKCGGDILKGKYGPYCSKKCGMNVGHAMGATLSDNELVTLLNGKKLLMQGLRGRSGKVYAAYLIPKGIEDFSYVKDGNKMLRRVGVLALSLIMLMCGCTSGQQEELSNSRGQLLQAVTAEFIGAGGYDMEKRFLVIDISTFDESLKQEYNEWVQTNYADEDTVIVVLGPKDEKFEKEEAVENYLRKNGYDYDVNEKYDWTSLRISRKDEEKKLRKKEVVCVDISYKSIMECEGFEVTLQYKDKVWTIKELEPTYMGKKDIEFSKRLFHAVLYWDWIACQRCKSNSTN